MFAYLGPAANAGLNSCVKKQVRASTGVRQAKEDVLFSKDHFLWDNWSVYDSVKNAYFRFSLSAPREVLPDGRHSVASLRYFVSKDGKTWTDLGLLLKSTQKYKIWSGSARSNPNGTIDVYYTQSFNDPSQTQVLRQLTFRPASESGAKPVLINDRILLDPRNPDIVKQGSKLHYHFGTKDGLVSAFRDPFLFDGEIYFATKREVSADAVEATIGRCKIDPDSGKITLLAPDTPPVKGAYTQVEVPNLLRVGKEKFLFVSVSDAAPGKTRFQVKTSIQVFRASSDHGPWVAAAKDGAVLFSNESRIYALNLVSGSYNPTNGTVLATGFYRNSHSHSYSGTQLIQLKISDGVVSAVAQKE